MLFQLQQMGFGYINGYGYSHRAEMAHPPNTTDVRRIWGMVRVGLARLAQARQNRPRKGELDLTDIDLDRTERQPPFPT
jgi:hypothetical protein